MAKSKHRRDPLDRGLRGFVKHFVGWVVKWIFDIHVVGAEYLPVSGPALIVSNHVSYFDIPILFHPNRAWLYFVAKKELFDHKIFGRVMRWWQAVPIDRDEPMLSSIRDIMRHLKSDHLVAIFPEGTRIETAEEREQHVSREGVIHFALKMNVPIVPMSIQGSFKFRSGLKVICNRPFYLKDFKLSGQQKTKIVGDLMQYIYHLEDWVNRPDRPAFMLPESELSEHQARILAQVCGSSSEIHH